MQALGGRGRIAFIHYWPRHRWGWVVSVTPRPRFTHPMYSRLGGPQSWSGHMRLEEKSFASAGDRTRLPSLLYDTTWTELPERKRLLGRLRSRWKDNIKTYLNENLMGKCWLEAYGSEYGPVARTFQQGNELSNSIKRSIFFDYASDYRLPMHDTSYANLILLSVITLTITSEKQFMKCSLTLSILLSYCKVFSSALPACSETVCSQMWARDHVSRTCKTTGHLSLLHPIREVPASNVGPETGYPEFYRAFTQLLLPNYWDNTLNYTTIASFYTLSNSSFMYHLFIRRYIVCVNEKVSLNELQINKQGSFLRVTTVC
jgi:hypothetical protein